MMSQFFEPLGLEAYFLILGSSNSTDSRAMIAWNSRFVGSSYVTDLLLVDSDLGIGHGAMMLVVLGQEDVPLAVEI